MKWFFAHFLEAYCMGLDAIYEWPQKVCRWPKIDINLMRTSITMQHHYSSVRRHHTHSVFHTLSYPQQFLMQLVP